MPAINRYYSSVAIDTTLSFSITTTSLTFVVGSTAGFPTSYPYTLAIGYDASNEELVTIVGASGNTLTVGTTVAGGANIAGRGVDGTNDQAHSAGEIVKHVISARDMTESQAHIAAESGAHGITGSFVGTTDTQTLTNKTITGGTVNATTLQQGGVPAVTTTGSQTLTTKTFNLTNNTLTGTIAQFNTALSDADFATIAGTETLTNKTLTSPAINTATITSPTITVAATGSIALGTNASAIVADSKTISAAEVGYLDGVTSAIQTQLNTNTPVGTIIMYGGTAAPTGWLLCNGNAIPSQHTTLIALVGANTPDLMGRVPVGYGNGSGLTNRSTLFFKDGFENVTLTTAQIPSHQHGTAIAGGSSFNMTGSSTPGSFANWFAGDSSNTTVVTDNLIGGGGSHPNMQPFTVVNFIIKF